MKAGIGRALAASGGAILLLLGLALAWVNLGSPHPIRLDHSGAFEGTSCTEVPAQCVTTVSWEGALFILSMIVAGGLAMYGAVAARRLPLALASGLAFASWIPAHAMLWWAALARGGGGLASAYYANPGLATQTQVALGFFALQAAAIGFAAWQLPPRAGPHTSRSASQGPAP